MAFPTALALWTALGGLTAYRALVRPARALIDEGSVSACPGDSRCNATLTVVSDRGISRIYSLATGIVTSVGGGTLEIASHLEPVLLSYSGPDLQALIAPGTPVKIGQIVAQGSSVSLAVTELQRSAVGLITPIALEPASYLASRGLRVASRLAPTAAWCGQGRKLAIPQAVGQCGLRLPDPAGFSLLPVSARLE